VSDETVHGKPCASFTAFDSLPLPIPFGLCMLFFLPLQFFLALLEGSMPMRWFTADRRRQSQR